MFDNEKILLFESFEKLSGEAAKLFLRSAVHAVREKGFFTCAFSGGTSPQTFFRMLAEEPFLSGFPWGQSHFFQVDERELHTFFREHDCMNQRGIPCLTLSSSGWERTDIRRRFSPVRHHFSNLKK